MKKGLCHRQFEQMAFVKQKNKGECLAALIEPYRAYVRRQVQFACLWCFL